MSNLNDPLELYENGKHRRYGLLLAVNSGAFAIVRFLLGESGKSSIVLDDLTLQELAIVMAILNAIMVWSIYVFGDNMHNTHISKSQDKAVIIVLGALLFTAWLLFGACLAPHA